jgi:hypothetical protein
MIDVNSIQQRTRAEQMLLITGQKVVIFMQMTFMPLHND